MILFFRDKIKGLRQASFSKAELSLILGVYSRRVQRGEWRDYAIDCKSDMALFSVFRSAREQPLYMIAKFPSRSILKPAQYAVFSGQERLKESASLGEVLSVFEDLA